MKEPARDVGDSELGADRTTCKEDGGSGSGGELCNGDAVRVPAKDVGERAPSGEAESATRVGGFKNEAGPGDGAKDATAVSAREVCETVSEAASDSPKSNTWARGVASRA